MVSKIKDFVDTLGGSPPKDPLGTSGRVRIQVALAREPWDASHPHSHTLDNIRFSMRHPMAYAVQCPGTSPAGTSQNGSGVIRLVVM